MKNEALLDLYADYLQSEEYGKSQEVKESNEIHFKNYREIEKIISREKYSQIEDMIGEMNYTSESVGFLIGFKFAVKIMTECGYKTPVVVKV